MGGKKGKKTEPRKLWPIPLTDADNKLVDFNLKQRIQLGEEMPYLGREGEAAMALRTHLRGCKLWKQYRKEAENVEQVLVPYSFRHRYAKASHAMGFPTKNIADAMGHTKEVHDANYASFQPDGTVEMYEKAFKEVVASMTTKDLVVSSELTLLICKEDFKLDLHLLHL